MFDPSLFPETAWAFVVFIFGALMGSFGNVLIYRVPHGKSFVAPRSRCPGCGQLIRWFDNIPMLSWLVLRGRCRACRGRISWRYPLVEFLVACLWTSLYLKYGWSWTALEYGLFVYGLVIVSFIDLEHMILPDVFTLGGMAVGFIGALLNPERAWLTSLSGVFLGFFFLWAIAAVYMAWKKEEGMGGGDIKLLGWIGALIGWKGVVFTILSSSIVGSLVGVIVAAQSQKGLKAAIPFGPYLALGAIVYVLGGDVLIEWYLRIFIPSLP